MKTTYNPVRLLLLCILVLPALGTARAVDKAALWPSDALSKVMRSDTPKAGGENLLQIAAARADLNEGAGGGRRLPVAVPPPSRPGCRPSSTRRCAARLR